MLIGIIMTPTMKENYYYKGPERRQYTRYDFPYPVRFRLSESKEYISSFCGNISLGGLMLISPVEFHVKDKLDISISYSINTNIFVLNINGSIIWTNNDSKERKWMCGIQYLDLSEAQKTELEKFINGYCKNGSSVTENYEPRDAREYFIRGVKKFENDIDEALKDFTQAIQLDPNHVAAYFYRAFARDRLGDTKGAEEDFLKSKELGGM